MKKPEQPLIIVESPSKARTLARVLGPEYTVVASVGHIRDLPTRDLGVDPDNNFEVTYEVASEKKKIIKELKLALKGADVVYLATDPDREGEAISWHLMEILNIKVPVYRLVFHEVTNQAIKDSFNHTREIDLRLVRAQEARRILDRLVGYKISPILWRKIAPRLSAGRVQSAAVRMVVERERARWQFNGSSWWDIRAEFATDEGTFLGELVGFGEQRLVRARDFDRTTGDLHKAAAAHMLLDEASAGDLATRIEGASWTVTDVVDKPAKSRPAPPFTTATLQQAGYNRLRFSSRKTMQVAQKLYEGGYITYMRTDSTTLSAEALAAARSLISSRFGADYLPEKPQFYKTKVKNAQEAHEAIRPAGSSFRDPEKASDLDRDGQRLYDLIYRRTLASQMMAAKILNTTAEISGSGAVFRAKGKVVEFQGYMAVYAPRSDDDETALPKLTKGQTVRCNSIEPTAHETKPPARYTEATLIKEMEAQGIGRPSTYASIMDTIQRREYVLRKKGNLIPTFVAVAVVRFMETVFSNLVDYQFTARMEDALDEISRGELEHIPYLKSFYFGDNGDGGFVNQLDTPVDARTICTIALGNDENGEPVNVRIGKYGPYLEHGEQRASLDLDVAPADLKIEQALEILTNEKKYPRELGTDPDSGEPVLLKKGRYGPYVQLGNEGKGSKQKSLFPNMQPDTVNLEAALELLSLPRTVGLHPDSGDPILADLGRYGPYIKCGTATRSLKEPEEALTIDLAGALEALRNAKRRTPEVVHTLGKAPEGDAEITVKAGRYGPYITDGKTNVSLKKGEDPASVTLEDAVARLKAKAAAGPTRRRRKTASKKRK